MGDHDRRLPSLLLLLVLLLARMPGAIPELKRSNDARTPVSFDMSGHDLGEGPPLAVPPLPYNSSCLPGCHVHGTCNEELGRCDCPRHWTGPDCMTRQSHSAVREICFNYGFTLSQCREASPCFNSCNGRGRCIAGICKCDPGFWGMDCALSYGTDGRVEVLAGQGYVPRSGAPKVYVYELPPNMTSWFNVRRIDRPLHLLFWQRLMSAGIRTADGDEADYYFIPINTRMIISSDLATWALPYVKRTWPYWRRDNGTRHFIIHTGDMGVEEFRPEQREVLGSLLQEPMWLTHWGLHTDHVPGKWRAAHRPGKDIVIPVMVTSQGFHLSPLNPLVAQQAKQRGDHRRPGTFFFAGRICGDRKPPVNGTCLSEKRPDYSAFTRQRVYMMHHNRAGFKVVPSTKSYHKDISSHKFCLAPTGGGHGKRNVLVSLMGCLPVTVTDHVLQPFEPEMPWAPFAVHVPERDIPRLHEILGNISDDKVAEMQSKLHCAAQHLFYSSSLGAIIGEDGRYDAFETIIEILRLRKEHPGVPPERYIEVDERWRRFVNCDLGGPDPRLLCTQGSERVHPDMPTCAQCHAPVQGNRTSSAFLGWAGGLVCCSEMRAARCPRIWK